MNLSSEYNYDSEIVVAVNEWLDESEGFSVRWERMPRDCLPWLYEAARIGASLVVEDKVEGLLSDLNSAIEVAWGRGAHEWVRLNYPDHYKRLAFGE